MMSGSEVHITLDNFQTVSEKVVRGASKGVRALAFAVQEQAIENIRVQDAIDTGSLRNSIYVETRDVNERASVLAAALAAGQTVGVKSGKPGNVQAAQPGEPVDDELMARVAACVEHGIYVEMGVTGSAFGDQPARPYLGPAGVEVQSKAAQAMAQYISDEVGP